MKYRLNKAEKIPVTLYNVPKTKEINGREVVTYNNFIKLAPGEEYETDDEAMLNWFREHRRKVRYSKSVEESLSGSDVPYEIELCRSCGGKVRKISYQLVEVYE